MFSFWTCAIGLGFVIWQTNLNSRVEGVKYILQWARENRRPNFYLGPGMDVFIERNCAYNNCYVTDNKNYFENLTDFDAIMFDTKDIKEMTIRDLPKTRHIRQKYILTATESAHRTPICKRYLDNFFNWTWTYKLNSDLPRPFIKVYNYKGIEFGPKENMKWPRYATRTYDKLLKKLAFKTDAVAWFVDECETLSKGEKIAKRIQAELEKFGWGIDNYGGCASRACYKNESYCHNLIQGDYYFYLAFETSIAEDFVTDTVLTALNNYAVPVVYGGANYSRFLPPGSYLDARQLSAAKLAEKIARIIYYPTLYYEFFWWRNHFKFEENDDVCGLCALMNNEEKLEEYSSYGDIRSWFNGQSARCPTDYQIVTKTPKFSKRRVKNKNLLIT